MIPPGVIFTELLIFLMKRFLILTVFLQVLAFSSGAQHEQTKYYCPPCNCSRDGILFDKPGICPDSACTMDLLPVKGAYQKSKVKMWVTFLRSDWLLQIYDVLILPAVIQGIILSLILIFRRTSNRLPSYFLAALIISLSLQNIKFYYVLNVLISYISNTGGNPEYNIQSLSFPISGVLFIGPALHFYVRSLSSSEFKFRFKHLLHFVPGFLFMIINSVVFFGLSGSSAIHSSLIRTFSTLSSLENALAIVLSFYYIFLSVRLMQKHELWVHEHFSTTSRKSLHWLRNLIISLSFVWVIWLFAVIINFFTQDFILTYLSSYPFQTATSVIIFWIGYVGFIQGEIFSMELSFEKKMDTLTSVKKGPDSNHEVKRVLLKAMEHDKLFLVPDLSLAMLGHQLSISPKNISITLNNELNKNFHDFINEYRIEEVKKRLRDHQYEHLTILAIAMDSGFNSKSSFNRVFMKATGMSPKEYKRNA